MDREPILVIMAAGIGSRFGGLKQLAAIGPNNETIIHYSLKDAIEAGFKEAIIIIRRETEPQFSEIVESYFNGKIKIRYAYQEISKNLYNFKIPDSRIKPWGTGHAVLVARELVNCNFLVINADDYYGETAYKQMYNFLLKNEKDNEFAMVGYKLFNTLSKHGGVSRGVCELTGDMYLKRIYELRDVKKEDDKIKCRSTEGKIIDLTGNEITSMNFWGFTPIIFKYLEDKFKQFLIKYYNDIDAEFYLPRAVNELIQEGSISVKVYITDEHWYGITYQEDVAELISLRN